MELGHLGTLWPVTEDKRGTVFTTASVPPGTVYKQYNEHFLTVTTIRDLKSLVERLAGRDLPAVAHPTALVVGNGLVTGFLMRESPPGLVPPDTLLRGDAPVPPVEDLRSELTSLLHLLHAEAVTLGDRPVERLLIDTTRPPHCFVNAGDELQVHARAEDAEPDGMRRIAMAADRAFVDDLLRRLAAVPPKVVPVASCAAVAVPLTPAVEPVVPPPAVRRRRWPVVVAVALVVTVGLLAGAGLFSGTAERTTAGRSTLIPPSAPLAPSPSPAGLVDTTAVAADPRAPAIAAMFESYFTAINNRDTDRALSVFDRRDSIDPAGFAHGVSTSRDTDVHLLTVTGDDPVTVRLTLRSEQSPGFGPRGRPDEPCTRWDITYDLRHPSDTTYLILRTHHTTSTPC